MRPEADVPIEQRYLCLRGKVSATGLKLVEAGLPSTRPPDTEVLFVAFAYADVPFTKQFDVVFPQDRPHDGVRSRCRVIAATQQFSYPLSEVEDGWETVCIVHFSEGIPQLVQQLPVLDSWPRNASSVCICDEETWEHLKRTP